MITEKPTALTLEELSSEVAHLLERYHLLGAAQDARVSAVPDGRTIRYYTTLGLIDRPTLEGRQARYGRRHLLQLLAVKALQGAALPLAEIQSRIYGRSDAELEALLLGMSESARETAPEAAVQLMQVSEIVVEPGLRLLVESNWAGEGLAGTLEKLSSILTSLKKNRMEDSQGGKAR